MNSSNMTYVANRSSYATVTRRAHRVAFAFSPAARSAFAFSRSTRRSNFPLGFLGIASMNSTPPLSHLYWTFTSDTYYNAGMDVFRDDMLQLMISLTFETSALIASASAALVAARAAAGGCSTMYARGNSPLNSSGTGTMHTSATSGWLKRWPSSSAGATWKPRTLINSYRRG